LHPGAVYSYATRVGRKSRAKRTRRADTTAVGAEAVESAHVGSSQDVSTSLETPKEQARGRAKKKVDAAYPGARVARVAVDDPTWAAFRDLCGATPASIKLGQLVRAEVHRVKQSATEDANPETAIRAIRERVTELERYLRSNG
jgi:hypothetical protein